MTKNELKKQLKQLGIMVVGNRIKKKDVVKIIAVEKDPAVLERDYRSVVDGLKKAILMFEQGEQKDDPGLLLEAIKILKGTNWNLAYQRVENFAHSKMAG